MHTFEVLNWLAELAPLSLSEDWDNTGLLLGDRRRPVARVMTCLTVTEDVVAEAVEQQVDLLVSHHPLPFRPLQQVTSDTQVGSLLWELANQGISLYAPHTAWDSAPRGINQRLAHKLGLQQAVAIVQHNVDRTTAAPGLGAGRMGDLPAPVELRVVASRLQQAVPHCRLRGVDCCQEVQRIAIACGSGGSLLGAAIKEECDLFVTGEATFHTCLEARAAGVSLLMMGHYARERFAMDELASELQAAFPQLTCWASRVERDPVRDLTID